jgi:DNA-binding GntR family transcriptional regulator
VANQDLYVERRAATLRLRVEDRLRTAISEGHFRPGQRLIERELCELTGVGRTSIREALRQLEAEGLVTAVPHRGPAVSTMSFEEACQLYAIRGVLEGFAGRLFAVRHVPKDVQNLMDGVARFAKAAKSGKREELIGLKTEFYAILMRGCGNMFVEQMLTTMHNRITLLRMTSMSQPGRLRNSVVEIRAIAEAIKNGDPDKAEAACRRHVEQAAKVALGVLGAVPQARARKTVAAK